MSDASSQQTAAYMIYNVLCSLSLLLSNLIVESKIITVIITMN